MCEALTSVSELARAAASLAAASFSASMPTRSACCTTDGKRDSAWRARGPASRCRAHSADVLAGNAKTCWVPGPCHHACCVGCGQPAKLAVCVCELPTRGGAASTPTTQHQHDGHKPLSPHQIHTFTAYGQATRHGAPTCST